MLQTVIRFSVFSVNILQRKPFSNAGGIFNKCNMRLFFTAILRGAASVKKSLIWKRSVFKRIAFTNVSFMLFRWLLQFVLIEAPCEDTVAAQRIYLIDHDAESMTCILISHA